MSINRTNRIIDPSKIYCREINRLVVKKEARKRFAAKFNFINLLKLRACSQCLRMMSGYVAKLQIENKRENAPICIPCIMGIPRIVLKEKEHYSHNKKFQEFKKRFNKEKILKVISHKEFTKTIKLK